MKARINALEAELAALRASTATKYRPTCFEYRDAAHLAARAAAEAINHTCWSQAVHDAIINTLPVEQRTSYGVDPAFLKTYASSKSAPSPTPGTEPAGQDGVALIATERSRQITEEGLTLEHDDKHVRGEMLIAAADYMGAAKSIMRKHEFPHKPYAGFPWEESWWKPSHDPIRNLVKAGALIAAEIDRLQRKAALETIARLEGEKQ